MNAQDRYNSERYPDMTCFLALRNIERNERKERRNRMKENWIYRRGDVYLANLDPYIGSEQGGTRPVVVLQNNTGNYYCPTLIVAPRPRPARSRPSPPTTTQSASTGWSFPVWCCWSRSRPSTSGV